MPIVNITFREKQYPVACDEGQEPHLMRLAEKINRRVDILSRSLGKGSDIAVLLMAALMLEDELENTKKTAENTASQTPTTSPSRQAEEKAVAQANIALSQAIIGIAEYVESIAKQLETA